MTKWESIKSAFRGENRSPKTQKAVQAFCMAGLLFVGGLYGYVWGFTEGTGFPPFVSSTPSVLPPEMQTEITEEQIVRAIAEEVDLEPVGYGEGNNCIEMALVAARKLHWGGYGGTVVRLDFTDGSGHWLVGVPTVSNTWTFWAPEGEVRVHPRVGGRFLEKTITGMFYLYDFVWKPIEFGEVRK